MTRQRAQQGVALGALAMAVALPAAASAKVTELGPLAPSIRPVCPEQCQALDRVTGYQAKVGPDRELYQAPADGRIVSWTIALGKPSSRDIGVFDKRYGKGPRAAVIVLDSGAKLSRTVVAKAPMENLTSHLGQTVEFPLTNTLAIKKGQYVALTVPTWAPALQVGLGPDTSWRSSRSADACLDTKPQFALLGKRTSALFRCLYKGVRLTYSATFINDPTVPPAR